MFDGWNDWLGAAFVRAWGGFGSVRGGGKETTLAGVWNQGHRPLWQIVWAARGRGRTAGSGNVGREEKEGGDIRPPCWCSDPAAHAGRAGRDGPAAGAGRAVAQPEDDRVVGLSAKYEGAHLAKEEARTGRESDGDGSKVAEAVLCPRDRIVRAVPESWKPPPPAGIGMKGSEEGLLQ